MKMSDIVSELKLRGLRIFRIGDVVRLTGKSKDYVYLLLSKSKLVFRVQNGLYYLPDADPLEIASNIVKPSYISLISAFAHYGLVDQIPNVIKVITTKRHRKLENIQNMAIEFKSVKENMLYGYGSDRGIVIADVEKAIIDSLYLNEDTHYLNEVIKNLEKNGELDTSKLIKYSKRCGKESVAKKADILLKVVR
jgi:predicted transcriptional regulator of viral defense system